MTLAPSIVHSFSLIFVLLFFYNLELSIAKPSSDKDVIIQMFEWDWDSIASECTNFIGPTGYGYVQISPTQEHVEGDQWWTDYQPITYNLTSKRGNRDQLKKLIDTCHAAGVKVIADTVFNHMSSMDSGKGVAGTPFTHYEYVGIYGYDDFHHCGLEPYDTIVDSSNIKELQTCQLANLSDLATEKDYVQSRLAEHGNDLIGMGVDGFRLDSAKLIADSELASITGRLTGSPYITQEIIITEGDTNTSALYSKIGDIQEFRYTTALMNAFAKGAGIQDLEQLDNRGWVPSDIANVFVANHDTERKGTSLNNNSQSNTYELAMIFSLAHSYGTPTILSSYTGFGDAGAPNGGAGTCNEDGSGSNGWICQHHWPAIAGMVGFRNAIHNSTSSSSSSPDLSSNQTAVTDTSTPSNTSSSNSTSSGPPITKWYAPTVDRVAFARGKVGFIAINNGDTPWTEEFDTGGLPQGKYCDIIAGPSLDGSCKGQTFDVSDTGKFTATVALRKAIAIHTGAMSSGNGSSDLGTPA